MPKAVNGVKRPRSDSEATAYEIPPISRDTFTRSPPADRPLAKTRLPAKQHHNYSNPGTDTLPSNSGNDSPEASIIYPSIETDAAPANASMQYNDFEAQYPTLYFTVTLDAPPKEVPPAIEIHLLPGKDYILQSMWRDEFLGMEKRPRVERRHTEPPESGCRAVGREMSAPP